VQSEQPEESAASSVPEPDHEPTRPVRWGDRVKPRDVLVHPRSDRTADTQPVPVVQDDGPDPRHGPEAADAGERDADLMEDTAPHPIVEEHDIPPSEAPSGRLRSTAPPPDDCVGYAEPSRRLTPGGLCACFRVLSGGTAGSGQTPVPRDPRLRPATIPTPTTARTTWSTSSIQSMPGVVSTPMPWAISVPTRAAAMPTTMVRIH